MDRAELFFLALKINAAFISPQENKKVTGKFSFPHLPCQDLIRKGKFYCWCDSWLCGRHRLIYSAVFVASNHHRLPVLRSVQQRIIVNGFFWRIFGSILDNSIPTGFFITLLRQNTKKIVFKSFFTFDLRTTTRYFFLETIFWHPSALLCMTWVSGKRFLHCPISYGKFINMIVWWMEIFKFMKIIWVCSCVFWLNLCLLYF